MAPYQRLLSARSDGMWDQSTATNTFRPVAAVEHPRTKYRLLTATEVPPWYAHNSFLLTGYRPVTRSTRLCLESLRCLHNETVNIYSHLVPAGIAVISNGVFHLYFRNRYPTASCADQLAFHVYLCTSILCFGISSIYHTLLCHSEDYVKLWALLDYVAIIFQTLGSFISGIYVSFYCEPGLQKLYWTMIGVLGLLTATVVVSPRFQSSKWRKLRLSTFVATGFSALAPMIHASIIFPYAQWNQQAGLGYYLLEGLSIITGTIFYATRFPESWMPERFDIWGASHQIFHIFVVLGAVIHVWAILSVFDYVHENPRCLV
ncbi:hemolysin-III family protein [Histoplasma capsulatum G186AR]|nr:hemolysin-III family protein [Histoplasma capsulatum]QSS72833.1 hemolysin-III family protein [Histoplasma capsulatum G186AR]